MTETTADDRGRRAVAVSAAIAGVLLAGCNGRGGSGAPPAAVIPPPAFNVVTYHYDTSRTGWNNAETALTPTTVSSANFRLRATVAVDEQVDAQPLVVAGMTSVGGQPTNGHDVVYVVTENNTVYAIDGMSGAILTSKNFGKPLHYPQACDNAPSVGITSTPVIDLKTNTMYFISYTQEIQPTYRIHAIDITTLQEKYNTIVSASHTLADGTTDIFDASVQRQRSALLELNGNIYAGFGSFCDFAHSKSRGWILGWQAATLTPLAGNQLNNTQATGSWYLSSVWMSGAGLAAYGSNIVAVTGNSNQNGLTYDAAHGTNFPESIIEVSSDLTKVVDWFTPPDYVSLEINDYDFGSGGVLVIPGTVSSAGGSVGVLAAAGKAGVMYVLNAGNLGHGGPAAPSPAPLATPSIGYCWCAESYYVGSKGPTIVSSGGGIGQFGLPNPVLPDTVQLWTLPSNLAPGGPPLANAGVSEQVGTTAQDGGFFTSVSSSGPNNVVIWAMSRPDPAADANGDHTMSLYAFSEAINAGTLTRLFKGPAGAWANVTITSNSTTTPVVANGRVYVATFKQLQVFGLN